MLGKAPVNLALRQLASSLTVLAFAFVLFYLWNKYDWNYPDLKVIGFVSALALIYHVLRQGDGPRPGKRMLGIEAALVALVLVFTVHHMWRDHGMHATDPPFVDIGTTTVKASGILWHDHKNPYESVEINPRSELIPEFRGFHYGPVMLVAYVAALPWPKGGYKAVSALYVALAGLFVWLLVKKKDASALENATAGLFGVTVYLLPERFWYEMLNQGANDIFPVALILGSVYLLRRQQHCVAGLLAGLSFSAKFSPAAFFIVLFLRKEFKVTFFAGVAAGLLPIFAFLAWDRDALINNVFKVRVLLRFDSTSLYSITPASLHFIFPLALSGSIVFVLLRNFRRPIEEVALLTDFTFLITMAEVTFKEIHTNHFIWFYPLYAILLASHRHQLYMPPNLMRLSEPALAGLPGAPSAQPAPPPPSPPESIVPRPVL